MSRWLGSQCGHIGLHTAQAASASSRFLAQMLDHCTSVVHATGEYSRGGFGERPNAHAAQFGSYCFQFAAKLGVLLGEHLVFHREGCLFCEAGGGRGPVGVAVRAQRGSLRRGLCNSPPTFLEDRQDYLQHLGGRRREIRHPPRSFAEQAHNRRAWLKTPPKGATSRRQGATAAQVRRGHRLPLSTRALVAGTTGMARPQALQRQRCQVASPTTGRLLVRLTSLPILALL